MGTALSEISIDAQPDNHPFGYLLTLDLYGCRHGACDNASLCGEFLNRLVEMLRLTRQAPASVVRCENRSDDQIVLLGWVPMVESAIHLHTIAAKNFVSIDVFYLGKLHSGKVFRYAKTVFEPRDVEMRKTPRGWKYRNMT